MTDSSSRQAAPRKVLLATDLSARGDRALERAIAIASGRNAHLMIVHAFEELEEATLTYGQTPHALVAAPPGCRGDGEAAHSTGLARRSAGCG